MARLKPELKNEAARKFAATSFLRRRAFLFAFFRGSCSSFGFRRLFERVQLLA
jgi:hypothetical protein